ncbi:MAG: 3,4-dihydroxy-2-butanone-4-phosphate synthase [Firmicutes bacterium]|nr:3,4-dihydroxy-2-butanone-4-phosphate synthase [Alicyclobacillaceae bacterium]MCL6497074.1 3,4-dihydroxy-2-butanone-4-phosphate synthase [Bacillota bacterium]
MAASLQAAVQAIEALREGRMAVILGRLNGVEVATLVRDAETVTPADINYMAWWGRGLISCAVRADRLERLAIPRIDSDRPGATAFCVSVDARRGTTTGISAHDRALTARVLADPLAKPEDLVRPGHLLPIRVEAEGLRQRPGLAEAAVALATLAGRAPVAVTCPMLEESGEVAGRAAVESFARREGLTVVRVADLLEYLEGHVAEAI